MNRNHVGHGKNVTEEQRVWLPAEPPVSLIEISRVLEETARLLRRHAEAEGEPGRIYAPPSTATPAGVRAIIAARWLRREFLGADVGESEWSLMLELYAARLEGRDIHQTGLAVAAGLPQTTALHATRRLLAAGIFEAAPDPRDKRRLLIRLSEATAGRIGAYLGAATRIAPPVA
jgi:DNA-binding MarR family transcriptional regulator